ncbi:magnesium transporter CorA family protein [Streptosporangium sp. NPDC023963]|uniref:magnesium transporter CorA family protein n=1 Tax=Streptosporangium sp. NPDC023963 TaxID=3155608 RepID=UPI0034162DD4
MNLTLSDAAGKKPAGTVGPRTRLYRDGVLEAEGLSVAEVSAHVGDPSYVIWFDLCAPDAAALAALAGELDLHELAVEDVLQDHQRSKLDIYDSHLFLTVYGAWFDTATGQLGTTEVNVFVTRNALVTVRENDLFDVDEVVRRWDSKPDLARHGVVFLLHGLLDVVVDGHFQIVQNLDDRVEALEDRLFADSLAGRDLQRRTFDLRRGLVRFRRIVLPLREVVNSLLRHDLFVAEAAMAPYFRDVYDHVMRVTEWTESLRELVSDIREAQLSMQGYHLNDIMKKVTSWAAIIAVPTMITGFYGQNLPFPGFGQLSGVWTSVIVIAVTSALLFHVFRSRGWI